MEINVTAIYQRRSNLFRFVAGPGACLDHFFHGLLLVFYNNSPYCQTVKIQGAIFLKNQKGLPK